MASTSPLTLVALHGHDEDPATLASLLRAWCAGFDHVAIEAPRGPVATPRGAAWWSMDSDGVANADHVAQALERVAAALGKVQASERRAVLVGFSQGAALALTVALAHDEAAPRLAGVVAMAGYLPELPNAVAPRRDPIGLGTTPVLMVHGVDDAEVPVQLGRSVARYLERSSVDVTWVERSTDHRPDDFRADVVQWLSDRVSGAPARPG